MPSIGSILSTARSAMLAQQAAVQVTSHNIANASTEGYSRQRVMLAASTPVIHPIGAFGTGVHVHDVGRVRETLLDQSYRDSATGMGFGARRFELLSQVEGLFMEPSEHGLGATLDSFFNAWSDLASNPTNSTARTVVRETASRVVAQFQRLTAGLDQIRSSAELRLKQEVGELNSLTAQVADLNVRILATEAGGHTAGDLRDARDRIVDRMSSLVPVEVMHRSDGTVGISTNGMLLVDGGGSSVLRAESVGSAWTLVSARGHSTTINGGSLGGTLSVLNTDLPAARRGLDTLAAGLADAVNAIHSDPRGVTPGGVQGGDFFDTTRGPINADNLALAPAILSSVANIAAGFGVVDADGNAVYAAGATDIATAIAALRDGNPIAGLALGPNSAGSTPADFYASLVTGVGAAVRSAGDTRTVQEALAGQADLRRTSISGVSIDEELVNLIRFQNSYAAAARMITAADEMMQTVLGMVR